MSVSARVAENQNDPPGKILGGRLGYERFGLGGRTPLAFMFFGIWAVGEPLEPKNPEAAGDVRRLWGDRRTNRLKTGNLFLN